jgi:hypothetical protein
MKVLGKRFGLHHLICGLAVLLLSAMIGAQVGAVQDEQEAPISYDHSARNYSGLTGLVAMVCNDAMEQFYDFFDPAPVAVEPFVILGEFSSKNRICLLSATLADQMTAVISNESIASSRPAMTKGGYEQRVQGILQEVDGYLRLHISGINTRGERRSYVVNVEMSEPIYRALHSYVFRQ